MSRFRRAGGHEERGAVIPIVALALTFLMAATALSVDIGRLAARTRDLQSVADLAALDGARLIDGRTEVQLYPEVDAAVMESAARNGFLEPLAVDLGCFDRKTSAWDTGCARPDSVRVEAIDDVPFYFPAGSKTTSRAGIAQRDPWVDFGIGSLEAGINPDAPTTAGVDMKVKILNATIDAFFEVGVPDVVDVDIDLVGYRGLAAANIVLGDLAARLGFASADELLSSEVRAEDVVLAMADLLDAQGNTAEADALNSFAADIDNTVDVQLGQLFGVTSGDGSAATATVDALELLVGGVQVVNGANFADTAFDAAVGPVRVSDLKLVVVENAVRTFEARLGDSARTTQMRASMVLELPVTLDLAGAAPLPFGPLPPPPATPVTVDVRLPIVVEMAAARAEITGIACKEPFVDSETAMRVFTDALRIQIGETADLEADDLIVTGVPIIDAVAAVPTLAGGVTGGATFAMAGYREDVDPPFTGVYDETNRRRVYGFGGPSATTGLVSNLTTSLGSAFTSELKQALDVALPNLDDELFAPLFEIGGVGVGGADVTAYWLECTTPKLVD